LSKNKAEENQQLNWPKPGFFASHSLKANAQLRSFERFFVFKTALAQSLFQGLRKSGLFIYSLLFQLVKTKGIILDCPMAKKNVWIFICHPL
jgi:hypothetical protein